GDVGVEARGIARHAHVAPADECGGEPEDQGAAKRQLLPGRQRDRLLLGGRPFDGEQVDANHRSPALRSARPTATAAVGRTFSGSVTPNFAGSNAIVRKGSKNSTA